jgi:hypothetical protein
MKVAREAFLYLDLRFVLFWRKNIGAKAARNMLVKLKDQNVYLISGKVMTAVSFPMPQEMKD